mgnify:CR=1 FL=1|tara:strand:+ start:166 stop:372 length:207 start_codon:yes stop_codon:yes gene_type:complete
MNGLDITKETFEKADTDTRLSLLFDIVVASHNDISALKKRKRFDTTISSVSGAIGGALALIGIKIFWK